MVTSSSATAETAIPPLPGGFGRSARCAQANAQTACCKAAALSRSSGERGRAMLLGVMLDRRIADAFARLPDYLGSHVLVSVAALALGLAVSLPLAIYAARRP